MANKLYNEESIRDIAVAIREKNGTQNTYNVGEMGDAVRAITTGDCGITPTGTINITTNGTHDVTQYASASVNVQVESGGINPSGDITITENGRFDVTQYANAIVNVATSSGNGDSGMPSNVKTGVLNLENDSTNAVTVTHGCGITPRTVACIPMDNIDTKGTIGGFYIDGVSIGFSCNDNEGTKAFSTAVTAIKNITETTFDFAPRSASYPLIGGHSYLWVAMV